MENVFMCVVTEYSIKRYAGWSSSVQMENSLLFTKNKNAPKGAFFYIFNQTVSVADP